MQIETTPIADLLILTPRKFEDERGFFIESFNAKKFNEMVGREIEFVQDNESVSRKNVLRGLHFQQNPHAQGKLVRVVQGRAFDVAVDIRKSSATYGQWFGLELSADNNKQFWIPEGFAHGFVALEEGTKFQYKCTNYYHPQSEASILWNDSTLNIDWNVKHPIISSKDKEGQIFSTFESLF